MRIQAIKARLPLESYNFSGKTVVPYATSGGTEDSITIYVTKDY